MRRACRSVILAGAILAAFAPSASASDASVTVDWRQTAPLSGLVVGDAVELTSETGGTFPLMVMSDPVIRGDAYALIGRIRYRGVVGEGLLEMWSVFPDGARYFSRTLADRGPQAVISGDSEWRDFELPFFLQGSSEPPVRLELDLVLPGAGQVWIGPLELTSPGATDEAWWSDRMGGVIGGIGGSLIGVTGAVVGILVAKGRARRAVLATMAALAAVGGGLLVAGAVALALSQPYPVYYPLFLGGIVILAVFGVGFRRVRRSYEEAELRRMRAMDTIPS
jgi:hypothetical protein